MPARVLFLVLLVGVAPAADKPAPAGKGDDAALVGQVHRARKEYAAALVAVYEHYLKAGDTQRAKWAEDELKSYHLAWKPSYRLDILDVPSKDLEPKENVKEANDLFKLAKQYKDKGGSGPEYVLNQRRAELLYQDILSRYPTSDKIADVAYELGELYEGKAFRQYDRAAAYFERSYQWGKGGRADGRMRAARLYDRNLTERSKAIELYRDVVQSDTDAARIKEAERRLAELTTPPRGGGN
jgi:TolA-binding protein